MKYPWKKLMLILVFILPCTSNALVPVGSTVINITGTVTPSSCTIASGKSTLNVNLGSFGTNTLTTVGKKTATTKFTVSLTGCTQGITGGAVYASGTSDPDNPLLLRLSNPTSDDTAKGVGIELTDSQGTVITVNSALNNMQLLHSGSNEFNLYLGYVVTKLPVIAGKANAVLYLDMYYQ